MKKAIEELIALLERGPTFSHAIEEQIKTVAESATTSLAQWDISELDSFEQKLASCAALLSVMIDDIESQEKRRQPQDPAFAKVKEYLVKQHEALTLIREKIVCAKIASHVQQLEERIQQLLFSRGPLQETKNEMQKYFTQLAEEITASFAKNDVKNKFTSLVTSQKKNWPPEMHEFYSEQLNVFLSNYYKK